MIISHKYQFIFIPIPKTASQAIRVALRPSLHQYDWEQCQYQVKKYIPIPELAQYETGHLPMKIILPHLLPKMQQYFKFAFVRHPVDRFFSAYFYTNKQENKRGNELKKKLKMTLADKKLMKQTIYRPQYTFVTNEHQELIVDFIGRFENLASDLNLICNKVGLEEPSIQRINFNSYLNYQRFQDKELTEMLLNFYKIDFDLFNFNRNFTDDCH